MRLIIQEGNLWMAGHIRQHIEIRILNALDSYKSLIDMVKVSLSDGFTRVSTQTITVEVKLTHDGSDIRIVESALNAKTAIDQAAEKIERAVAGELKRKIKGLGIKKLDQPVFSIC